MTQTSLGGELGGELLSTTVKRVLLDRILGGEYEPGARIVELQLAKEFGTSQSPIREALRDLAALGIVTMQPRRGARVRVPTGKELSDVSVVRSELDALAARLAVDVMSPKTLDELSGYLAEMTACAERHDYKSLASADARFHATIAAASGNSAVARVFEQLEPFARTFITFSLPNVDVSGILREHAEIMAALVARDPDRAAVAAREHQLSVSRLLRADSAWSLEGIDGAAGPDGAST
jgi:DNA-binding GntR family transcriptional regulator